MGKEMRVFDRDLLEKAHESLVHSGGTRSGQMCHFEADVWHELLAFVAASLRDDPFYMGTRVPEKDKS